MTTTLENKYYVYLLLDPSDYYKPFYVGKGSGERCRHHLTTKKLGENKRKDNKIAKIRKMGFDVVVMKWAEHLSEQEAYALEETLILRFGRRLIDENGVLMNLCLGAKPPAKYGPMPQSQRDKISQSNKGRKWSPESRARASEARRGQKRGPPSPDTIEKIRQSNTGITKRKWTTEEKAKLSMIRQRNATLMTEEEREEHSEKIRKSWEKRRDKYGPSGCS